MTELPSKDREYLGNLLRELALDGPHYRPKVFKHLSGELWEVRDLRSPGPGYRIYFGFDGKYVCLVASSGDKSSQQRDIKLARERLRMEEEI
ncbi:MAG: type II toxin-antitoxin system RelE/ParE family toxin [Silvanigrellaceae bacterium]|nr:type II toxin-antitoxin system RelE/ParE family toxin [Silvanigrellaceae bacterium]